MIQLHFRLSVKLQGLAEQYEEREKVSFIFTMRGKILGKSFGYSLLIKQLVTKILANLLDNLQLHINIGEEKIGKLYTISQNFPMHGSFPLLFVLLESYISGQCVYSYMYHHYRNLKKC